MFIRPTWSWGLLGIIGHLVFFSEMNEIGFGIAYDGIGVDCGILEEVQDACQLVHFVCFIGRGKDLHVENPTFGVLFRTEKSYETLFKIKYGHKDSFPLFNGPAGI